MIQSTTITQKWQMTLPKQIREALGFFTPGRVVLEVVDKKEKLLKIKKEPDILELAGFLKPVKGKSVLKAREVMEKTYQRI
ncbi:hypothetical protein A3J78_00800 [Candidatus Beckwithbacteria bacterium RBG_13_35_6]|uniref:SpoVT-AbrB domain-containing protein n=1 Tax=Candidatus Beckwithbacteria bacterium RBG_13_35_6 TaxID=1797456 RepID=A0A1F5DI69_9BACT|nr:MAG: hypothetical protein A3J78_00800 [Candidatus Beckwithbacteria bacterium RBG_13_35_6]